MTQVYEQHEGKGKSTFSPTEIVKAYFEAFLQGDLEAVLSMLTDDVLWHVQGAPNVPTVGFWQGKLQVKQWILNFPQKFKPLTFELDRYFESGDEVIVTGRFKHLALPTNREVGSELAIHFKTQDGLISSYKILEDSYALFVVFKE